MANRTNTSTPHYSYEYYLDYLDPIPVDEKKLKAHKHSIVIAFWVSLVAFVLLLFLILLYVSWSGSVHVRNSRQHHQIGPWNHSLNLPFCLRRASQGSAEESGSRTGANQQQLQDSPSTTTASTAPSGLLWEQTPSEGSHGIS